MRHVMRKGSSWVVQILQKTKTILDYGFSPHPLLCTFWTAIQCLRASITEIDPYYVDLFALLYSDSPTANLILKMKGELRRKQISERPR